MGSEQGTLFPEPTPDQEQQIDISRIAEHVASSARFTGSPDRTSEAARDQGWRPSETNDTDVGSTDLEDPLTEGKGEAVVEDYDTERFKIPEDTIELGRRKIQEIREQNGWNKKK